MFNYIKKLATIDEFKLLKEKNKKIVFVFSASWCPDCVMLNNYFEESISKFPEIEFIYVDRDEFPEITEALDIFGIPSFIAYRDNKEISRFVSKISKTQDEVEAFLKKI
ncbi:thioredoxin family protein [Gemella cuniculi]|uniref:thioredoxin family protein n=1 Tax=Gemella cuniculi TaxID=150240 RepID=UPI0004192F13|nr:thioredoxin family protein [Gemella cuniculi]